MLETEMQKLLETNLNQNADALPRTVDAGIVFTGAPYIMYELFQLDNNFKTYLEVTMKCEHVLRMGIKPYQKSFELITGTASQVVDFKGANKQFSLFSIALMSNQHRSIYDSYNAELANTKIKSITLENASNTCSTFNSVKFDTSNPHDNFLLHNQFVAWYCKDCSIAPSSDYTNNHVFQ